MRDRNQIDEKIITQMSDLLKELKQELIRLQNVHGIKLELKKDKTGKLEKFPKLDHHYASDRGMGVDLVSDARVKIDKYNFLQTISQIRKDGESLTKERLNAIKTEY